MTNLEHEIRMMLTKKEIELMDRYMVDMTARDGAIAHLVAMALREKERQGVLPDQLEGV